MYIYATGYAFWASQNPYIYVHDFPKWHAESTQHNISFFLPHYLKAKRAMVATRVIWVVQSRESTEAFADAASMPGVITRLFLQHRVLHAV